MGKKFRHQQQKNIDSQEEEETMRMGRVSRLAILCSLLAVAVAQHPTYHVSTLVPRHPGWFALQSDFGLDHAKHVMAMASRAVWDVLDQQYPRTTKKYADVYLSVEIRHDDLAAEVIDDVIHLSAQFLKEQSDIKNMVPALTVVLFHEMTHIWQWHEDLNNPDAWGLFEGMADYVAVVSPGVSQYGYCVKWKPSQHPYWNEGYCQTMDFLRYCVTLRPTFVTDINKMMVLNNRYLNIFFVHLLGKGPDQLWQDYLYYKKHHPQLEANDLYQVDK